MAVEIIAGDFELDRAKLLGKGAWGEVFIGRQASLNRPVAIKILKKELTADPDFVRRFRREAECLAQLAEEHIIQVYALGEYEGSPYFIMEFVQGVSLAECMKNNRIFSVEDIVHVGVSVTKAFKAAWNSPAKIVHRDIKPANIMVSFTSSIISPSPEKAEKSASLMSSTINIKDAQVKVMDFGLAKLALSGDGDHEATMVGTVIGTPKYISPEQGMGNAADIRSDIYSLGIVLYEMATGKIPFEGESAMSMIRHHIYDTAMMISQNMADFPPGLEAIVMKCIQKAPEKRYQTPTELLEDLDAFEKNKPLVHATIDPDRAAASGLDATMLAPSSIIYKKRKKKIVAMTALVSTIVVLAGLALWRPWGKPPIIPSDNTAGAVSGTNIAGPVDTTVPEDPLLKELNELYSKADELYQQTQYEESKTILEDILSKKEDHVQSVTLLKDVNKKIGEHNEKLRLFEAMITDTLKSLDETKNREQQRFNLIIQNTETKDFAAARKENERLMEMEDEMIPPAATYLQMRIWLISLEGDYLKEMTNLLNRLNAMYSKSEIIPMAEKLLEEARVKQEELAVEKIIKDSGRESNLSRRAEMLDGFIKANETNQFIQLVKDKLTETLNEMEANRQKSYSDTIAKAAAQRQSNLYKDAYVTLESAKQYTDDNTEIDRLKALTEKEFLEFNGIEPVSDKMDPATMAYSAITNTKDSSTMILVPAGEFTRGDDNGSEVEKPAAKINLAAFYADKLEITNEQFAKFVEDDIYVTDAEVKKFGWVYEDGLLSQRNGASWKDPLGAGQGIADISNHPVVQVSWNDAMAYAKWARKRLLTEAEWEKTARADKQLIFPWGSAYQAKAANNGEDGPGRTATVGAYPSDASPYAIFDIAGNVAEWCADYYDASYYQIRAADNPKGPANGTVHSIRGGSWISAPQSLKLTGRKGGLAPAQPGSSDAPEDKASDRTQFWSNYLGFRCARDVVSLTK